MNTATCRSTARIVGFGPLKVLKPLRFFREISGTPKAFDLAIETWHVPRRAPCHALPSVAIRSGIGQSIAFAEKACHLLFRYIFSSRASPRAATRRALPATARRHERRRVRRAAPYPNSNSKVKPSQAKRTTVPSVDQLLTYSMHTALHVTLQLGTTHTPQPDSASVRVTRLLLSETHISLYRAAPATVLVAVGATCRSLTELQHEV